MQRWLSEPPCPQDLAITLSWAGHDTSSTALCRALWLLPRHPQVLAKLREEQRQVAAKHGRQLDEASLKECPYLEATVKELLRHEVGCRGLKGWCCREEGAMEAAMVLCRAGSGIGAGWAVQL